MRGFLKVLAVLTWVVLIPSAVFAQGGTIAGVAKDTSGAVLPGVTVEAASPALIEKTRTVVTDGSGQYKVVDLRPGTYSVTFTLPGFNTVKRDGIEITGIFTASVNADMKVGAVKETITVSGEAPVVDVQSTTRERVMSKDVIDTLPTGRMYGNLGVLVPGVNSNSKDVGGNLGDTMAALSIHGGSANDQRILENGLNVMTLQTGGGNIGGMVPNTGAAQEVAIDTSAASAERQTGGVSVNFIPRDGGNTIKGSVFGTFTNESLAANNFTDRVKALGLTAADSVKKNYDVNPGFGGPIVKDKLWYYYTARFNGAANYSAGMFPNLNAFNKNVWTYAPDTSQKPALSLNGSWWDSQLRATWQANPKNKFAGTWDQQYYCRCPNSISATTSAEAANDRRFPTQQLLHGEWWSPITSRLLVEAVALHRTERWGNMELRPADQGGSLDVSAAQLAVYPTLVGVTEQAGAIPGLNYHGAAANGSNGSAFNNNFVPSYHYRAAVTYVTGTHSIKAGYQDAIGYLYNSAYDFIPYRFRFNNGVPNQITEIASPWNVKHDQGHDFGAFIQDRWTVSRMTINAGLRYDWYKSSYPAQHLGAGLLFPNRSADFAAEDNLNWKDITPRFGVSYDPFGDGKTALKATANKYVAGQALGGLGSNTNPILRLALTTARTWTDANHNFVPDCDLTNNAANGECAAANAAFGTLTSTQITDSAVRTGWNVRGYNWEFSGGVQRQIMPRVSVDLSYYRRIFGNFTVTDDLNRAATDYDVFSIPAPSDPRLPNGGGYTVGGLYNIKPALFSLPALNSTGISDKYGKQIQHWNGVDFTVNARMQNGLLLQGGFSTGKTVLDNCQIVAALPEMLTALPLNGGGANAGSLASAAYCHSESPFLTQAKAVGSYLIPHLGVQVAGTFQSIPGGELAANYNVPSAQAALSLGRPLSGAAANQTVNILTPGTAFQERLNQLDFRVGKVLRFGGARTNVNLDLFNIFNKDTVLNQNNAFTAATATAPATWKIPTGILQSRLIKISAQFDF